MNQTEKNGNTGFLLACKKNSKEVVEFLITKYPDIINQRNNFGVTGFLFACKTSKKEVVELLLTKYPDIIN